MSSTSLDYRLVAADLPKSLERKAAENSVKREIDYFKSHIEGVTSIDAFLGDTRLYTFAMKAYGLEDMTYAKGFMRRVLTEGIDDKDNFANRLSDKRYRDFAAAFNFNRYGDKTTTWSAAGKDTISAYLNTTLGAPAAQTDEGARLVRYFRQQIGQGTPATADGPAGRDLSVSDILGDEALAKVARTALGLPDPKTADEAAAQKTRIGTMLDAASLRTPERLDAFVQSFTAKFKAERAAQPAGTHAETVTETVSGYVRRTLEQDAGADNEGVRLALYFRRKAPEIRSVFDILGDKALGQVVRTALGLPADSARANIDAQAAAIGRKLDIASLKDPVALDTFIRRFTSLWDVQSDTAQSPTLTLFNTSGQDLDTDLLLKLQTIRLGAH